MSTPANTTNIDITAALTSIEPKGIKLEAISSMGDDDY
jgi:hypothetical protein